MLEPLFLDPGAEQHGLAAACGGLDHDHAARVGG
jgi:hypothetical protein